MPFLEEAAKQMGVTTKDNWNPMDIVMVKKKQQKKIEDEVNVSQGVKFYTKINDYGAYNGDNDKFF